MKLDLRAGKRALKPLAKSLNLSPVDTAQGIVDVANANIDRAVRRVSVARGYDPRDFTLVAFGGAGALHACAVAERLGMERVVIPRHPGVLCAYGLLVSNVVIDYTQSILATVTDVTLDELAPLIETMLATAKTDLIAEGIDARDDRIYEVSVDLRYAGQAYELNVPMDATRDMREVFHEVHHRAYGHHLAGRAIEIVNLRVQAIGLVQHPPMLAQDVTTGMAEPIGTRDTPDGLTLAQYQRDRIQPGHTLQTPALVFQLDSTVFIPAGWQARADAYDNLELTHGG